MDRKTQTALGIFVFASLSLVTSDVAQAQSEDHDYFIAFETGCITRATDVPLVGGWISADTPYQCFLYSGDQYPVGPFTLGLADEQILMVTQWPNWLPVGDAACGYSPPPSVDFWGRGFEGGDILVVNEPRRGPNSIVFESYSPTLDPTSVDQAWVITTCTP